MGIANLAQLHSDLGHYQRAEELLLSALSGMEEAVGRESPQVATILNNLGGVYNENGDYDRAKQTFLRALTIGEKVLGPEHPSVATTLNNFAWTYVGKHDEDRAEQLFLRSLSIREGALGPEHPHVAVSLQNLAHLYSMRGEAHRAEPLLVRAIAIYEKAQELRSPDLAGALLKLSSLYWGQGRLLTAVQTREHAITIENDLIEQHLGNGSESRRRAFMKTLQNSTDGTISLHIRSTASSPDFARLAMTVILQRKGRIIDALAQTYATLRSSAGNDNEALLKRLITAQQQLAALVNQGRGDEPREQYNARVAKLEAELSKLEDEVGWRSASTAASMRVASPRSIEDRRPVECIR
jgi:tetratricopeptide (TPR) repeat protein